MLHYLARFGAPGKVADDSVSPAPTEESVSTAFAEGLVPHGGGRRRVGDRAALAAIIFVATSGCTWRQLPSVFGASWQTVHRRFFEWSAARAWAKLHRLVLDELGTRGDLDWSRCASCSVNMRVLQKGELIGPNPVDRGK